MAYRILDLEASAGPPPITLLPSEDGLAVLVRDGGAPVGFFLAPMTAGASISSAELETLIQRRAGLDLTRAMLRPELTGPPATAPLDLTVAVCTRDRTELLTRCLASLQALEPGESRLEILVVDNAPSGTDTRDLVASLPGVRYVLEPRPGLDIARNRALAETTTQVLAFVDDDVVVDRWWLDGLAAAYAENPEAAAVTGLVLPFTMEEPAQVLFERRGGFRRGMQMRRFAARNADRPRHPLGAGAFGTGANMSFRAEVLRALGGFDPALDTGPPLPGGGDLDMFYRVLASGRILVYAPAAAVWHRHRPDLEGLRHQYWTWGTGYFAFLHKTFAAEPARRADVVGIAAWWLRREALMVLRSVRGSDPAPPAIAAAQFAGGVATALWKYPWSRARIGRQPVV